MLLSDENAHCALVSSIGFLSKTFQWLRSKDLIRCPIEFHWRLNTWLPHNNMCNMVDISATPAQKTC